MDDRTGIDPNELTDPETLAESLLDAAAFGNFDRALAGAMRTLEGSPAELDADTRFRYRVLFFDLANVSTTAPGLLNETALGMLAAAPEAGPGAWSAIQSPGRVETIERLVGGGEGSLELLELMAYSPDEGTRGLAITRVESLGLGLLDSGGDTRPLERLLHGVGATEHAYRLEHRRKQQERPVRNEPPAISGRSDASDLRRIALAGGHQQMRTATARMLGRTGIVVVEIPSSRESVRRERDVVGLLQGCDLAIVLVRQITHSTSDQVRRAAERLGVPLVFSNALSAVAVDRQLFPSSE